MAVFDWDNTVIKNDIGDATTFFMLLNNKILKPVSWKRTSRHLTGAALDSLNRFCPLGGHSRQLHTQTDKSCATAILCIYYEARTWDGQKKTASAEARCRGAEAFRLTGGASGDTVEPGYAWTVSLQAGHTPDEMREIALAAFREAIERPVGATLSAGYVEGLNGYIRVYPQMRHLIAALKEHAFDVWVSTASSQYVVDAIAPLYVDLPAQKVIGVKSVIKDGRLTPDFRGCGTFGDGQGIINYRQGKRCWLNRIVFGVGEKAAQLNRPSPISFAAGDSDTDAFFLKDADGLRLVINRNKKEVMCHALENIDGKWVVNPMFIQPKKPKKDAYSCSSYRNVLGKPIPPQREVF